MHSEAIDPNAKGSLEYLSHNTDIFTDFYLAGGTAAAIQLGHRISVDLDLFTTKDFVDFAVLSDHVDISQLGTLFRKKFPTQEMDLYHYVKSLTYFEDADMDPDPIMLIDLSWDQVKGKMRSIAKAIELN